jgi:hypothetical protein
LRTRKKIAEAAAPISPAQPNYQAGNVRHHRHKSSIASRLAKVVSTLRLECSQRPKLPAEYQVLSGFSGVICDGYALSGDDALSGDARHGDACARALSVPA